MSTDAPDDPALADRIRRPRDAATLGDAQAALLELYRRHAPGLLAFLAARGPRADLEDLHQEVWLRVWRHAPHAFDGRHFRGWLYTIARHLLIERSRKRGADPADDLDGRADPAARPVLEALLDEERRAALARCLEKLGEKARELVRGRLAGEDYAGLCRRLALTEAAAYKLFHTAKAQLRRCVEEAGA
jgi:RNA polymerase sigma-70 factor (ECF subfamily)